MEIIMFNNNNNLRGAYPLPPARGHPIAWPVNTGNAGIWFALSCLGFSQSQLPRPMPSGHFICMAQPTTEDTTWKV